MTEFKQTMTENSLSGAESYILELMRGRRGVFTKGVIAAPLQAVLDELARSAPAGMKLYQQALLQAIKEAGWIDCGRVAARGLETKRHVYCAPDLSTASASELRRMVEV
jgi:hypothetical protein